MKISSKLAENPIGSLGSYEVSNDNIEIRTEILITFPRKVTYGRPSLDLLYFGKKEKKQAPGHISLTEISKCSDR